MISARLHRRNLPADTLTPVEAYRRLRNRSPVGFLLESVVGGEQVSRYSMLATGPSCIYRLYPDRLDEEGPDGVRTLPGKPLEALNRVAAEVQSERQEIPFVGGLVGYLGFETASHLEVLPPAPEDPFDLPQAVLARFDSGVVFDRVRQRVILVSNEIEGERTAAAAREELDRLHAALETADATSGRLLIPFDDSFAVAAGESTWEGEAFRSAVERVREHISAGDAFQVVLARRWVVRCDTPPLDLYRALRIVNPSPYMVLLELPELAMVGASPEMLVRVTGNRVETRPIAGTRRRGRSRSEDRRLEEELRGDAKERAEHLMLVDLGRNDIGRIASPGSVRVDELMDVERYSHVMHLVSSVKGDLKAGLTPLDALLSCFPAGTVSGAPKIRAIEILRSLEPEARGPYAGAVGYLSFAGDLDSCITIRTLVARGGEVSVTAGAGIVADSNAEAEERETENKAAGVLAAIALAGSLRHPS